MTENIKRNSVVHCVMVFCKVGCKESVVKSDLGKFIETSLVRMVRLKSHIARKFLWRNLAKAVKIFTQHHNIGIIIPRNEPFVTNCTEKCSAAEKIFYVVLSTNSVGFKQKCKLNFVN